MAITEEAKAIPESFTVRLTDAGRNDLALIASRLKVSVGEALSRAVGMEAYLIEQEDAGAEIIVKDKSGDHKVPVRARGGNGGYGHSHR